MSGEPNDLPRLLEDGSVDEELRRAIGEAQRVGPSPLESAAMSAALAPILGPLGGGAAGGGAASGSAASGATGGATGSVGMGTLALGGAAATAIVAGVIAFVTLGQPTNGPAPTEPQGSPLAAADDTADELAAETPELSGSVADDDGARRERSRSRARVRHRARPSENAATETPESVETPVAPSAVAGAATPDTEAERSEAELLEEARAALRSEPSRALALAAEHERRFAGGPLAQEREVIAIEALVRLGRRDAARERADRFRARFRSSLHHRHIEALLER